MKMRTQIAGLVIMLATVAGASAFDHNYDVLDRVLKAHVESGRVDYRTLKANRQPLDTFLNESATVTEASFKTWSQSEQLAFLINLYNADTLQLIIDHYPVKSIKDIGSFFKGPWDQDVVKLFGKTITLNNLEHDIIRKQYNEPRIHMALVCAAAGCPPLRSEAFVADRLDEQLDDQSRTYLASPKGMRIDTGKKRVYLSAIFKWYGDDFPSVTAFVEKHSGKQLDGLKMDYLDYDWSLNDK